MKSLQKTLKTKMGIDGILNVNKPEGPTSFKIVARLRRLIAEKHVGHAGTLDPIATGVLPVCLGQATRITEYLANTSKTYFAQIELGIVTDTFDREGEILERYNPGGITLNRLEEALASFRGAIDQVPPAFSALKQQGRRCYELARAGVPVQPKPRRVEITRLELVDFQLPIVEIEIDCTKGTYIRSLANDIGKYLECGAHLRNLRRLRYGPFSLQNALSPDEIEEAFHRDEWKKLVHPMDSPLWEWKAIVVNKSNEIDIRTGRPVPVKENDDIPGEYCRAYNIDGNFLAVMRFVPEKWHWHPEKVFSVS